MALALSTKAKIAAVTLTAATLIGGAFSANAQQMASGNAPDFSACDRLSATAPAKAIQCRVETLDAHAAAARRESAAARRETAVNQQRLQAANSEDQCLDRIKAEMDARRISADAVRTALAGRRTRDVGACNLLGILTRS